MDTGRITDVGSTAPDFTLLSGTMEKITLSMYRGKPVLLSFLRDSG